MERVKGIEPLPTAWKAVILPLNHTRNCLSGVGFEPTWATNQQIYSLSPSAARSSTLCF